MVNWIKLKEENLEMVREWRMRPDITRGMYTDPVITPEDQQNWFKRVNQDATQMYWVVYENDRPIGLASIININRRFKSCESGVYLAEKHELNTVMQNTALFLHVAFNILDLNRIESRIMSNNKKVVRYHELQGWVTEGVLRQAILKNGEFYDLYIQSIIKDDWESGRVRIPKLKEGSVEI